MGTEYYDPNIDKYRRVEAFGELEQNVLIDIIEYWFNRHYENPAIRCPYEEEYIPIYGSFVFPEEAIREEFEGIIEEKVLQEAIQLFPEDYFSPIPDNTWSDEPVENPQEIFEQHIDDINRLIAVSQLRIPLYDKYLGLLLCNTITSFEVCIADILINDIKENQQHRDLFLETKLSRGNQKDEREKLMKQADKYGAEISQAVYEITFSNPNALKRFFLTPLGLDEPTEDLKKLNTLYSLRNDIMHRNGKTKEGAPTIKIDAELLQETISCVSTIISNINDSILKNNEKKLEKFYMEIDF